MNRLAPVLPVLLLLVACRGPTEPSAASPTGPSAAPEPEQPQALAPPDSTEGLRVARRVGCTGCHGEDGAGKELWSVPDRFTVRSANLTEKRGLYTDEGLHALLGEGRTHDGHAPFGMPVFMLQRMSVRERSDVIAWMRTLPPVSNPSLEPTWLSADVKRQIDEGTLPEDDYLPDPGVTAPAERPTDPLALGEYLAMTSCTECHGRDLRGWAPEDPAPSLIVAKAYSPQTFRRLMREGLVASGAPSKTGFMTAVAKQRFAGLHDAEIDALKAWLDARAP